MESEPDVRGRRRVDCMGRVVARPSDRETASQCVLIESVPVQFLPAYNPLVDEALAGARSVIYEEVRTRVLRPEHLIAICLQTGRDKDRERMRILRAQAEVDGEYLAAVIARHQLGCEVEPVDGMKAEIARVFAAKEQRRHALAAWSFPEKVAVVIKLQEMAAPVWRAPGKSVRPGRLG